MANTSEMVFEHSDEQALQIGDAAIRYILDGSTNGLPLEFRGLAVFGVMAALRQHDAKLASEGGLEEDQRMRMNEIENNIDDSLNKDLQYYPFGHQRNKYAGADRGFGFETNWGAGVSKQSRKSLLRERPIPDPHYRDLLRPAFEERHMPSDVTTVKSQRNTKNTA